MLKVIGITSPAKEKLNLEHAVIAISWDREPFSSPLYWRTGDFAGSLIEVGLEEPSGKLIDITLVIADQISVREINYPDYKNTTLPVQNGIPICDIKPWKLDNTYYSGFLDETGELRVYLLQSNLSIQLGLTSELSYWISSGRYGFGIDTNKLIGLIQVSDLSNQEMSLIKSILHLDPTLR